jgi:U4/U6 small nuclear ribonucleoprotein PRP3
MVPVSVAAPVPVLSVAPPLDVVTPSMEWWDEAFLPKEVRESRRISKAAADKDDFSLLAAGNNKTHRYVQHPVPVKPLGGDKGPLQSLPMFLTKKEQKKLRKATRAEREREKRDKQMMGLIPAPEPKFTLSNFMKVLGDQAVADPSKVELRVMQQMQQRVLNHEMRNAAAKLTPKERKEKKVRKLHEDTSRSVSVAAFRVTDFSNLKHRFKVDVNAQQHFLSGIVLLCQDPPMGLNLVVGEGGPKGIRKFVRLMTERIRWTDSSAAGDHFQGNNDGDGNDDDDDDEEEEEEEGVGAVAEREQGNKYSSSGAVDGSATRDNSDNRCDLLWSGILPKRSFTGFKFQEAKSALACRRLLEGKGLGHYWDMCEKADESRLSALLPEDDFTFG